MTHLLLPPLSPWATRGRHVVLPRSHAFISGWHICCILHWHYDLHRRASILVPVSLLGNKIATKPRCKRFSIILWSFLEYRVKSELSPRLQLEDELLKKCNTPCYGSPNLSLITIISGLVMHDATGLVNSESSQRHFWFNLNLNRRIQTNRCLVSTSTSHPWVGSDTRCY
jgi:hypothetical protein